MNIWYDTDAQQRCDAYGAPLYAQIPLLHHKDRASWTLHLLEADGIPCADLKFAGYRAAVDKDKTSTTRPCCRTPDIALGLQIDASQASEGIITIPLNCATSEFLAAVDGHAAPIAGYFELWGITADGVEVWLAGFDVKLSAVVDPEGGDAPASTADSGRISAAQVLALISGALAGTDWIRDAPSDGYMYARLNGAWVRLVLGDSGSDSRGTLVDGGTAGALQYVDGGTLGSTQSVG